MSEKVAHAPVYYALAQAHFSPVAAMNRYVEEIQDSLRREGYPRFEPQQITQLVVPTTGPAQLAEPQIAHTIAWLIMRADRAAGFILTPSAITYHTTHYTTHKEFIPELIRGLMAVHKTVALDHVSRLGLRYLDALLPKAGERVEQYLADGLRGIEFGSQSRYALTESVFGTTVQPLAPEGTLVVRVYRMHARLGFPPDMLPRGLVLNARFDTPEARAHAVIDTDHYVEGQMPIDEDKLGKQLRALHATIKTAFLATITDHARKAWA